MSPIAVAPAVAALAAPTVDVLLNRMGVSTRGPWTPDFKATVGRLEMLAACVSRLAEPGVPW